MRTPEENRRLAGKEFNEILRTDPVLLELEHRKYDKGAETRILLSALGLGRWNIGSLPVMPLTAARWAFLWILDNGFVTGRPEIRQEDADSFLFVLSAPDLRKLALPLHAVPGAASGFGAATGFSAEEVRAEIRAVIRDAFRPLELIPAGNAPEDEEVHYDVMWLTRICGIAARESGMRMDEVCHGMPLAEVCALFVNHLISESRDPRKFRRDPDTETLAAIDARFEELAEKFLHRKD